MADFVTSFDVFEEFLTMMLGVDMVQEEQNEDPLHIATYYSPLFPQSQRTDEFKNLFKECFGSSHICEAMPRPLMCNDCLQKYINNTNKLINTNPIYKDVILPRLIEIKDYLNMINEHNRVSRERISMDVVYNMLDINMDHYDPPSQTVLDQCTVTKYVKNDKDETCVICQCDYEEGDNVKTLICDHQFHDECVMGWLNNNSTCPICKTSLK